MSIFSRIVITWCLFTIFFEAKTYCQTTANWIDGELIEFSDDGVWAWFQNERAVVDTAREKLIVGSTNSKSSIDIVIYDLKNKKIESSKRFTKLQFPDEHNAPAVMVAPDGNYIGMWAHRYDEYNSHFSIYDGNDWLPEQKFDWTTIPNGTDYTIAYSNLFYLANEKRIYNIARANNRAPNFIYSDDNGTTWKYGGQLTAKSGEYGGWYTYKCNSVDRIDIAFTEANPRDQQTSIYHGYIQGRKLYTSNGVIIDEDIYDREYLPDFGAFTTVFAHGTKVNGSTMGRCLQHDIARYDDGTVAILFKARTDEDANNQRNFYARYNGTEWKTTYIGKAGKYLYNGETDYIGLGALNPSDPNRIYISSPYNPGDDSKPPSSKREIWRGTTTDQGKTWKWEPVTANSSVDNIRPVVAKWKPGIEVLLWCQGIYNTVTNISSKIVGTVYKYDFSTAVDGIQKRKNLQIHDRVTVLTKAHQIQMEFAVPDRSSASVQIFTLSGKRVTILYGNLTASGHCKVTWNTSGVPAKIYYAVVRAGKYVQMVPLTVQY